MEDKTNPSNLIGYIGDNYILLLELSFGGDSFVYKVEEKSTHKIFAAKIAKDNINNLKNEIRILKILKENNYKNIINLIDSGEDIIKKIGEKEEKKNYLILELGSHHDISEYIRYNHQGFKESHSKVLFFKMVKCIQTIHELGICHRDIKLDNFLQDDKFNPLICDFGHAIKYGENLPGEFGTDQYKAPEIILNEKYDEYKSDIFSLGICLIELVSGIYAFYMAEEENKYYEYIIKGNKKDFWNLIENNTRKKFSDDLKNLSFDLLSKDPKKRPDITKIYNHSWFGNIPSMNPEELEKHENDINLKQELQKRFAICEIGSGIEFRKEYRNYLEEKEARKVFNDEDADRAFKNGVEPEFIKYIYFEKYFINIKGLSDQIDFINSLYDKISDKLGENIYNLEANSENGMKLNIDFYKYQKEISEENGATMQIILYKTSNGYVLRFLREKISKNDFFDKFEIISDLVKN